MASLEPDCKYHVVFVPKYRKQTIYGSLRRDIEGILQDLYRQQSVELIEGYAMKEHIYLLLMIPLKYSVANAVGFLKGKSAIRIFKEQLIVRRNFTGRHFWARGYCVNTVGLDEQMIREYIKNQEREEKRQEQLKVVWHLTLAPLRAFTIPSVLQVVLTPMFASIALI